MSILYPVSGGFYTLASRMLDPSFAFAMGWNYVFQWAIVLPLEIVSVPQYHQRHLLMISDRCHIHRSILDRLCSRRCVDHHLFPGHPGPSSRAASLDYSSSSQIASVFGTLGFAEEEFWASCLKLFVVVLFIFIGIVCICGGGPASGDYNSYVGGRYWQEPGAFANGFKGVCSVFVTAAFSFAGYVVPVTSGRDALTSPELNSSDSLRPRRPTRDRRCLLPSKTRSGV
jgi:amino acid transporter